MGRIRKKPWLLALVVLVAVAAGAALLVSCKTTPKPEPVVEPEPEPEPTAPAPKPEAEYAQAKELRATVTEFGLDEYEPDAFQKAEASFKDGEAAYGKDNAKSKEEFQQAIAGYQQVLDGGFPALTAVILST